MRRRDPSPSPSRAICGAVMPRDDRPPCTKIQIRRRRRRVVRAGRRSGEAGRTRRGATANRAKLRAWVDRQAWRRRQDGGEFHQQREYDLGRRPGRRLPERPRHRNIRSRIFRENNPRPPRPRGGPADRRHRRVRGRRARFGSVLCSGPGCRHRRAVRVAARLGRDGVGHRGPAGAKLGRGRHRRGQRRGPGPARRAGGRHVRHAGGTAGPAHEQGAAEDHVLAVAEPVHGHLSEPAAVEGGRDLRLAGGDERGQRAQVLRVGEAGHEEEGGPPRQHGHPGEGESRQEQGRGTVQGRRDGYPVRGGHRPDGVPARRCPGAGRGAAEGQLVLLPRCQFRAGKVQCRRLSEGK
mmetsp:Transcript_34879/g.74391  ORF Transcript_34879/g.74391 Transcript_34879/m.74391 type:complete len:351 (-) Transcript_34879:281-1333(-)